MNIRKLVISICCLLCGIATASADRGAWRAVWLQGAVVDIFHDNKLILAHNCAVVTINGQQYDLSSAFDCQFTTEHWSDTLGTGQLIRLNGSLSSDIRFEQCFYLSQKLPYCLTRITLLSSNPITSNYLAPVRTLAPARPLPPGDNRVLFVPYDNDEWITYASYPFGRKQNAYEVGVLYHETTHQGLILGSIEHTDWKSALTSITLTDGSISSLTLYAGASDAMTRDSIPHGALRGTTISSPLMMVGHFVDWRQGMETYADLCATVAPSLIWSGGKPFAWNSWGVIAEHLSSEKAMQCAQFIHDSLYTNGFQNAESTCYVGLDAFWNRLSEEQLVTFASYCNNHGMHAGIYWTPWVDWAARPNRPVEGAPEICYKDIWLYRNGRPVRRNNACALDPTHPATKARAEYQINKFLQWGYSYLKMDFMIHGAQEADIWYDTTITTGTQAYNYGMRYLDSLANGRLYFNLSIAPVFPANYAQGRRIACDAWAAVKDTKYTLNATTFSWWLDHIYSYNDGDHVVLRAQNEGVNRLRIASSIITGNFCLGDDFSNEGEQAAKNKAVQLVCNPRILAMARETKAFRPLSSPIGNEPANQFYYETDDAVYVALFNYEEQPCPMQIHLKQLGLKKAQSITELWNGNKLPAQSSVTLNIPATDCLILQIVK